VGCQNCLRILLLQDISDCLSTDWSGVNRIDLVGGLFCIIQLPSLNLVDNSPPVQGRVSAGIDVFLA
jgi:hypothetical protein